MSSNVPSISANVFAYILLVLVILGALIILIALSASRRTRARLRLPWGMGFEIDAERESSSKGRPPRRPPPSKTPKTRKPKRTWLETRGGKWQYTLGGKSQYTLGRDPSSDIPLLKDPACSNKHAMIFRRGRRYRIRNLSSKGTYVNGRLLRREQNLGNGNKIRMGNTELIFREEK